MDDVVAVGMVQGRGELAGYLNCLLENLRWFLVEVIAIYQLHDHEGSACAIIVEIGFAYVVNSDDVGVVESGRGLGFSD